MSDLAELFQWLAADALSGRIRGQILGVRRFEVDQLAVERIVLLVGDRRGGFLVVAAVVFGEFDAERFDAFGGGGERLGHRQG